MVTREREPQPIAWSYYPREFWDDLQDFAERPLLQRITGSLHLHDDRMLGLVYAYCRSLNAACNGIPDLDFIPERDGQLGPLMDALLTHDAGARARVLERFEAWQEANRG